MDEIDFPTPDRNGVFAALNRLAAALDCPVEAFSDPSLTDEGKNLEFLRLWLSIKDERDRADVLTLLRSVSAKAPTSANSNAAPQASGEPVALSQAVQEPEDGS